ncbi:hypothetical protein ACSSS7_007658 [Eimeria intestinalis]
MCTCGPPSKGPPPQRAGAPPGGPPFRGPWLTGSKAADGVLLRWRARAFVGVVLLHCLCCCANFREKWCTLYAGPMAAATEGLTLEHLFAAFGKGKDLDSRSFLKICKDTKIIGDGLTQTDCDLIFTKCKTKGAARLTFDEFEKAMSLVAEKKKMGLEQLLACMQPVEGPTFVGTQPEPVRLHDDKTTYTGVHQHGGPSTIDVNARGTFSDPDPNAPSGGARVDLANLLDRTTPDVRGVHK